MNKLLDEKQAAALLNVSVKSLQGWRYRGGGPKFVKIGRRLVRYTMADLEAFVLARLRTSTSDSGRSPAYQLPACFTRVTSHEKSWPDLPPGPSAAPTPRPTPAEFTRSPTRRRHSLPRGRVRIRLGRTNQQVTESAPRPAR